MPRAGSEPFRDKRSVELVSLPNRKESTKATADARIIRMPAL